MKRLAIIVLLVLPVYLFAVESGSGIVVDINDTGKGKSLMVTIDQGNGMVSTYTVRDKAFDFTVGEFVQFNITHHKSFGECAEDFILDTDPNYNDPNNPDPYAQ